MRKAGAVLILALWLAGTAYLLVAGFWIIASTQWADPPLIYLGGLAAVVILCVWCSKSVLRVLRRLWQRMEP